MQEADKPFAELVHDTERAADKNRASYKLQLGLCALLGYGVIFIALGVLIALVGGTVAASLYGTALLIIPTCRILVKSPWVKLDPPQSYRLNAKTCSRLFEELEQPRRSPRALKIHEVILTSDRNAAIRQTPRLGVFGGQKNSLIAGLEVLLQLSPAPGCGNRPSDTTLSDASYAALADALSAQCLVDLLDALAIDLEPRYDALQREFPLP